MVETMNLDAPEPKRRSRKLGLLYCCAITAAIVLLLAVILIILAFTVFKQKDPTVQIKAVVLENVSVEIGGFNLMTELTASLNTNVSVYNPNVAGFKYQNSTVLIYYRGQVVAHSPISRGEIGARRTVLLEVPLFVFISGAATAVNLTSDVVAGVIPLSTTVTIEGTAKLGIFSVKHVHVRTDCSIEHFIGNGTQTLDCNYKVKL